MTTNKSFNKQFEDRPKVKVYNAMMLLAVCHTIITDEKIDEETGEKVTEYNASSPDELALLNFAKFMGFEFLGTDDDGIMRVKFR